MTERERRIKHYEAKAAEALAKADGMKDLEAKATMQQVAQMWRAMALSAKRQPN